MTDLEKQSVVSYYKAGQYNAGICEQFHISKQELYAILAEYNVPRKQNKGSYTKQKLKCKHCGSVIGTKDAKFCPYCGKFIVPSKGYCINALKSIQSKVMYLPEDERKKFVHDTEICISYIVKGETR